MYYTVKKKKNKAALADASKLYGRAQRSLAFGARFRGAQRKVATKTGRFSAHRASAGANRSTWHGGLSEETQKVRDWLVSKGLANGVLIASRGEKLTPTAGIRLKKCSFPLTLLRARCARKTQKLRSRRAVRPPVHSFGRAICASCLFNFGHVYETRK